MSKESVLFAFDLDGTLFDNLDDLVEIIAEHLKKYVPWKSKEEIKDLIYKTSGMILEDQIKIISDNKINDIKEIKKIIDEIVKDVCKKMKNARLFPDVKPFLEHLKSRGYKIYLISGARESRIKDMLKNSEVLNYFDKIFGAESGRKTEIIEKLSKEFNILFYFGDTKLDASLASLSKNIYVFIRKSRKIIVEPSERVYIIDNLFDSLKIIDKILEDESHPS